MKGVKDTAKWDDSHVLGYTMNQFFVVGTRLSIVHDSPSRAPSPYQPVGEVNGLRRRTDMATRPRRTERLVLRIRVLLESSPELRNARTAFLNGQLCRRRRGGARSSDAPRPAIQYFRLQESALTGASLQRRGSPAETSVSDPSTGRRRLSFHSFASTLALKRPAHDDFRQRRNVFAAARHCRHAALDGGRIADSSHL